MKKTLLIAIILLPAITLAQRVTDVKAEKQGNDVTINYGLEAEGPVEVALLVSTDQGDLGWVNDRGLGVL